MIGLMFIRYYEECVDGFLVEPQVNRGAGMNLNEECLLQFLKSDGGIIQEGQKERIDQGGLTSELSRVFRRNQYVSFPPAILVRRSSD
jgi:hypothetical protein